MDWMSGWLLILVFVAAFAICVVREPRVLRAGIFLMLAIHGAIIKLVDWELDLLGRSSGDMAAGWTLLGIMTLYGLTIGLLGLFLVLNGMTMLRREGRGPAALVSGALGLCVFGYFVLCLIAVMGNFFSFSLWVVLIGLPLLYLGFVFASFLTYSFVYGWVTNRFGGPVDAVIALGSGLAGGERVTPLLAARLDRALQAYRRSRAAGHKTVIVTSGGQGSGETIPEGEAMARYLLDQGVDPEDVVPETQSRTTRENLEFSARMLQQRGRGSGPVAVVTNNFHAFRAALLMRRARLPGYSLGSPTARYFWPSAMVREFFAVLADHRWLNATLLALLCLPMLGRLWVVATISS
ncbi:MAG TPA: YdcF family protein [Arthrobacter sp.]|nr:YdcF family protein [Arthrobacter sp.]